MSYISLGNLTRYDGKLKNWVDGRYASERYSNWQKTEKAGAVTCYPVPESRMEPVVEFKFKETPPAEGEKGPDNPSTIESVSNVTIMHAGKNLAYPRAGLTSDTISGVEWTVNGDGTYTANGTASSSSQSIFYARWSRDKSGILLKKGCTYTLSGCPSNGSANTYYLFTRQWPNDVENQDFGNGKTFSFTLSSQHWTNIGLDVRSNVTVSNLVFKPQLELGSTITEFEQPVYNETVVNLGNAYYGGYVDVANGILTVTQKGWVLDGTEPWILAPNVLDGYYVYYAYSIYINNTSYITSDYQFCSHYNWLGNLTRLSNHFYMTDQRLWIVSDKPTVEDFKSFLANQYSLGTPVTIVSYDTPYTVLIPPVEIRSLPFLNKMQPRLNTLFTDAESIQVGYQKSPIRTTYELDNAILSLGGNE